MNSAHALAHVFRSAQGAHLFVADRSRVYDIDHARAAELERQLDVTQDPLHVQALLASLTGTVPGQEAMLAPSLPPSLGSLSLNLAQACNMSCGYCYADEGRFGGRAALMPLSVAQASVQRLIADSDPQRSLVLGFIGGEPLLNRKVLHEVTRYAADAARQANRRLSFSLTTNATLLEPADARLLHDFQFHVSVSLDGRQDLNDRLRPLKGGSGSYSRVLDALELFKVSGRPRHLAARATVTPHSASLRTILAHHIELGFDSVGFAAVLSSPDPDLAFERDDFDRFAEEMISCGQRALEHLCAGRPYPFANLETALWEIHRGTHRPYPCGAGAGYMSVDRKGGLFACHRLIDDPAWAMGHVVVGPDQSRQAEHLRVHHVDQQQPCRDCWARYLCGGGCYHEVAKRGRIGCDYIRRWLEFCLAAYAQLSHEQPSYFGMANDATLAGFRANTLAS